MDFVLVYYCTVQFCFRDADPSKFSSEVADRECAMSVLVSPDPASTSCVEPPDTLLCPITYTLFKDPVRCVADGCVYERDGLVGFWRHRPMASFFGGAGHTLAKMHPAVEMREQVAAWLAAHPQIIAPPGWKSRDPGTASTQEVLDSLASEIEQLALGRAAAASAAEIGNDAAVEQVRQLCARSVRLSGRMPGGRRCEYLGVYDRLEAEDLHGNELLQYAGRCAYVLRGTLVGPRQPMLWHAVNGFWHAGERQYLGLQTGWLIVADEAAAPEHIVSEWKLWHDGRLWLAPRVRCVVAREDDEDPGEYVAASGEGPDETRRLEEERLQEEAEYGLEEVEEDEGEEDEYEEDEGDDGVHGRQAAEEVHRFGANDEARLASAAATVRMTLGARLDLVLLSLPEGMMLGVFVGEYTRCDEHELDGRVHGRYTYVKKGAPHVRMWWTRGFWHLGYAAHLGQQLAAVIAQSNELLPEDIEAPWKVFLPQHDDPGAYGGSRWEPIHGLSCEAGPAPPCSDFWVQRCWAGTMNALCRVPGLRLVWKTMLRDIPRIARYLRSARLTVWCGRLEELRGSLLGWFLINLVVGITMSLWLQ